MRKLTPEEQEERRLRRNARNRERNKRADVRQKRHEYYKRYSNTVEGRLRRMESVEAWWARNGDGVQRHRTLKGEYTRKVRDERNVWLGQLKLNQGCIDCGYRGDPRALQFDHVRGEKQGTISSMVTSSLVKIMAEIEKCDVRCANCHMIRTHPDAWRPGA